MLALDRPFGLLLLLLVLVLVFACATQAPDDSSEPIKVLAGCERGRIVVAIEASGPGVFVFHIPAQTCGLDV